MSASPFAFVYIVESPSPADLFEGRFEGRALCESLALSSRPHAYRLVSDLEQFKRALSLVASDQGVAAEAQRFKLAPLLHLSMHGNSNGVGLMDGSFISWSDLRSFLEPLNDVLPDGLLVSMSSCEGYSATRMSMSMGNEKPLFAVVGAAAAVGWDDALVGFTAFYHHLFKSHDIEKATAALRSASGDDRFFHQFGPDTQKSYLEFYARQVHENGFPGVNQPATAPIFGSLSPTVPNQPDSQSGIALGR